jgi:predicted acyl esterase
VFLGGWYDIFLQGTINSFVTIQDRGGPGARGRCRLFVGPIGHGVFTTLRYPANSRFPDDADAFRFFDRHLKRKTNGVEADKPVYEGPRSPTPSTTPSAGRARRPGPVR